MSKPYKSLKSSVRKPKSVARKMYEQALNKLKSLSATNVKSKGLTNTVKTNKKHPAMPNRAVRVMPLKAATHLITQLPDTDLSRKGLSLKKLLRTTPKLYHYNAEDVIIQKLDKKKTKSGLPAIQAKAYSVDPYRPNKTKRVHDLYIIGIDIQGKPVSGQKRVLVSCSCENYVFAWEYANAKHGASKLIYGNGDAPDFTNPAQAPGLCKHLTALAKEIIKKGM